MANNYVCGFSTNEKQIFLNGKVLCSYSYDRKQEKYICKHVHELYNRGFKFLYANSPSGLCNQLDKFYKKLES